MKKMFTLLALVLVILTYQSNAQEFWQTVGNVNGSVFSFATDSTHALLAGTFNALYKSTDDGLTWVKKQSGGSYTNFISIAVHKNGHLFAGSHSTSIYKSTDNGTTWTTNASLGLPDVRPLIALGNGDLLAAPHSKGLFRSTDEGATWSADTTGLTSGNVWSLAVAKNGDIYAGTDNSIFRSTDNGQVWTPMNFDSLCQRVYSLLICSNGDLLAGSEKASCGVFKSTDNGTTWNKVFTGLDVGLYEYVFAMVQSPNGYIFASTNSDGVYRSRDGGLTAERINQGINMDTVHFFWGLHVSTGGHLFVGTQKNIYRSIPDVTAIEEIPEPSANIIECYPNPASGTTALDYTLGNDCNVSLKLYSSVGREIKTLVDEWQASGGHSIMVNLNDIGIAPGIYYLRLQSDNMITTTSIAVVNR